jgi:hypothetical protein
MTQRRSSIIAAAVPSAAVAAVTTLQFADAPGLIDALPFIPPTAPATVPFALAPGLASGQPLDYGTYVGAEIFKNAVRPLDIQFDCQSENLRVFLALLHDRAIVNGWGRILDVTEDARDPLGITKNLLEEFMTLSLTQVQDHATTYVNQQSRSAQDSMQIYQCIMSSLTAKAKVLPHTEDYTVANQVSGTCLLKLLIGLATNDTNARTIRKRLSSLDIYMRSINSDVEKFNLHVHNQLYLLKAHGESNTPDLLVNLFKGYAAASNKEFVAFIAWKTDEYDDSEKGKEILPEMLMELALSKYSILNFEGEWNSP